MHKLNVCVVNTALVANEGHLWRDSLKPLSLAKSFRAKPFVSQKLSLFNPAV